MFHQGSAPSCAHEVAWCRDEMCPRMDLHRAHAMDEGEDFRRERVKTEVRGRASRSSRLPWKRPCPKALDHSIVKAVSETYPKHISAIVADVRDDYGTIGSSESSLHRHVQRHLARLVEHGHILRVDLGQRLFAYLRPGSKLASDVDLIREQILLRIEAASMLPRTCRG